MKPGPNFRGIWIFAAGLLLTGLACRVTQPALTPTPSLPPIGEINTQAAGTLAAAGVTPSTGSPAAGYPANPSPQATAPTAGLPGATSPSAPAPESPAPATVEAATPENTPLPLAPSGLRVAYAKEDALWLWAENGPGGVLTSGGTISQLSFSPDGQWLAFTRQVDETHTELWAIRSDGAGERRLVSAADFTDMDPGAAGVVPYHLAWVPESHRLAFNTREVTNGPGLILYNDLRLVDADTGDQSTPLAPGQGGEFAYSPDGKWIAVVRSNEITLVDAGISQPPRQALAFEPIATYSEYEYYPRPVWGGDSSRLLVAIPPAQPLEAPQPTILYRLAVSSALAEKVGSLPASDLLALNLALAPSLDQAAYLKNVGDPAANQRELHLAMLDGSNDRLVQAGPLLSWLGWAPDGSHFAFTAGNEQALFLGDRSGALAPTQETQVIDLRWADATRAVFLRGALASQQLELRLLALDGSSLLLDTLSGAPPLPYDCVVLP